MRFTKAQVDAMDPGQVSEVLRQALIVSLCEFGQAANIDPTEAASRLSRAVIGYGVQQGWDDERTRYALSVIAEAAREIEEQFAELVAELTSAGVEVWCPNRAAVARLTALDGCSLCDDDQEHITLANAAKRCTHGGDCTTHRGVTGIHNYDPAGHA
jgi:hypothetical protein